MNNFIIDVEDIIFSTLIFIRIGVIIFLLPFFGDNNVSPQLKAAISFALAVVVYPLVPMEWRGEHLWDSLSITLLFLREFVLGLCIGLLAKMTFEGMVLAANLVGYQMGFGTSNLILQNSDMQLNPFTAFHRIIVLLVFLSLNLHQIFIKAIFETFKLVPLGGVVLTQSLGSGIIKVSSGIFKIAIQLSSPIVVALLFTISALGLVARTVPQMNVFTMSFPISFFVGLITYIAMIPFFPEWMKLVFVDHLNNIFLSVRSMSP